MPRVSNGEGMLVGALNDLRRDWDIARSEWHDQAREQFEKEFIEILHMEGKAAVRAMTELSLLLRRVVRECS